MSFPSPYTPNYLLLDAARMLSDMDVAQEMNINFVSLYKGGPEQHLSSVAPYLFQYGNNESFENWISENTGKSWGVFVKCKVDMEDMNYHFRKFLKVKTEDLQQLYFRFYDPRVLRIFLPTCDKNQIIEFFGPVQAFICEQDEEGTFKVYSHIKGELIVEEIAKKLKVVVIEPKIIMEQIETPKVEEITTISKSRKWL
jgi:hypothetical protein